MHTLTFALSKHLFSKFIRRNLFKNFLRNVSAIQKSSLVLGIETSCDDTGCAIVDNNGKVVGESLHSQMQVHLEHGGIVPPVARNLHTEHIERVVREAVQSANINIEDVDAIATTVKPGLPLSLLVGTNFGKKLSREYNKPFIPIHHMEAHALTVRMIEKVDFPFLVLLISGGHCLLAVAENVDKFYLLGQSIDDAPGEAFDKTARRLSVRHIPEFSHMCGGQAIEILASRGDSFTFPFTAPLFKYRDCNFSVAGIKNMVRRHIMKQEKIFGLKEGDIIPGLEDLCAGFQLAIARHLCHRVQRGMEFCEIKGLIPDTAKKFVLQGPSSVATSLLLLTMTLEGPKTFFSKIVQHTSRYSTCHELFLAVVSGGVACNSFIRRALRVVCEEYGYKFYAPPPRLCTDNGIMIAWNGMERWLAGAGIADDLDAVDIQGKCLLGIDMREEVAKANLRCTWIKLKTFQQLAKHDNESLNIVKSSGVNH